ncbi:MAG: bifunctional 4-hydroxy-2-oxoglutarate aldolase/2-dehydro-3-deoxy-phosphogluconate aldolase [Flavipsychrobacter sp.]|nr:bifunctional 4-hydroxy-2-oxoglutarate aldolase/2-dehydro-3-deoxy-phosphogluconate aldolase [Flavipsychrobacter sp.]
MTKNSKEKVLQTLLHTRLLPLYFYPDTEVSIQILKTLYSAGIRGVEYTNRGAAALDNFKAMLQVRDAEMPDMLLGIGTIKTGAVAQNYIDAGADFLISPATIPEVAQVAKANDILWIPGSMTVTEIVVAEQLGCKIVKLFPGNMLGPGFVSAIKDLFPDMLFMPTGGVEVEEKNIKEWFKSGVCAVGLGSKLISKTAMENKDYDGIKSLTLQALSIIQTIQKN